MKYTIEKANNWLESDYLIRRGKQEKLVWQGAAIACWAIWLVMILGFAALATFVAIKALAFVWLVPLIGGAAAAILAESNRNFKLLPYKEARWDYSLRIESSKGRELVGQLKRTLEYKELQNFVDPDELVDEVILALKLWNSKKINDADLKEYYKALQELINECERRKYTELLQGKESHDSVVKSALDVAKTVNKELT